MSQDNKVLKVRNSEKDLNYYFNNFKAFAKIFQINQTEAKARIEIGSFQIKSGYRSGLWEITEAPRSAVEEQFYFESIDQPKIKTCLCGCGEEVTTAGDQFLDQCYYREVTGKEKTFNGDSEIKTREETFRIRK